MPTVHWFRAWSELLQQLFSSCNDESYTDVDCHDDGNPNDLPDPRQHWKSTEEKDKQKYAYLNLRAF
jgi:hypothetical protein